MNQRQLFILSFLGFFILIALQLIGIFNLFMTPILWSIILALVFYPLYLRIKKLVSGRSNLASLLVTGLIMCVTAGPMIIFSGTLVSEIGAFYQGVATWVLEKKHEELWNQFNNSTFRMIWNEVIEKTAALDIELAPMLRRAAQVLSQGILGEIQLGARNFLFFLLNYLVTFFILFFLFRDGESLGRGLKDLFPMTKENKDVVFSRLTETVLAVVRGLVVTGVVQASLSGLAFWILGVPYPVFFSLIIAFMALVPIGGAVLIWFPSTIYLFLNGHWIKALILLIWGGFVISTVDNILRPYLIGEKTKIPTLFLFLAILGGLVYYGLVGVFLGPVMLALFMTLVEIYRKEYLESGSKE